MSILSRGVETITPDDQKKKKPAERVSYDITVPTPYLRSRFNQLTWDQIAAEHAALGIDRVQYPTGTEIVDAVAAAAGRLLDAREAKKQTTLCNRVRAVFAGEQEKLSDKDAAAYYELEAAMVAADAAAAAVAERRRIYDFAQRYMAVKLFLRDFRNLDIDRDRPRRKEEPIYGLPDAVIESIDTAHLDVVVDAILDLLTTSEQAAKN